MGESARFPEDCLEALIVMTHVPRNRYVSVESVLFDTLILLMFSNFASQVPTNLGDQDSSTDST